MSSCAWAATVPTLSAPWAPTRTARWSTSAPTCLKPSPRTSSTRLWRRSSLPPRKAGVSWARTQKTAAPSWPRKAALALTSPSRYVKMSARRPRLKPRRSLSRNAPPRTPSVLPRASVRRIGRPRLRRSRRKSALLSTSRKNSSRARLRCLAPWSRPASPLRKPLNC